MNTMDNKGAQMIDVLIMWFYFWRDNKIITKKSLSSKRESISRVTKLLFAFDIVDFGHRMCNYRHFNAPIVRCLVSFDLDSPRCGTNEMNIGMLWYFQATQSMKLKAESEKYFNWHDLVLVYFKTSVSLTKTLLCPRILICLILLKKNHFSSVLWNWDAISLKIHKNISRSRRKVEWHSTVKNLHFLSLHSNIYTDSFEGLFVQIYRLWEEIFRTFVEFVVCLLSIYSPHKSSFQNEKRMQKSI